MSAPAALCRTRSFLALGPARLHGRPAEEGAGRCMASRGLRPPCGMAPCPWDPLLGWEGGSGRGRCASLVVPFTASFGLAGGTDGKGSHRCPAPPCRPLAGQSVIRRRSQPRCLAFLERPSVQATVLGDVTPRSRLHQSQKDARTTVGVPPGGLPSSEGTRGVRVASAASALKMPVPA